MSDNNRQEPRLVCTPIIGSTVNGGRFVYAQVDRMDPEHLAEMKQVMGPGMHTYVMRMCDVCKGSADKDHAECRCIKCKTYFDLCSNCKYVAANSRIECPNGYGCKA